MEIKGRRRERVRRGRKGEGERETQVFRRKGGDTRKEIKERKEKERKK